MSLAATLERTREVTTELRRQRRAIKLALPKITIYKNNIDGTPGAVFQGRIHPRLMSDYRFGQRENISSQGFFETMASHYMAKFIMTVPNNPDECKNILIRVDMYGGAWRWTGLMEHWDVDTRDGVDYLKATFNDDMQFVQFMLAPPNPALPLGIFQFPRDWFQFSPSRWGVSVFMLAQGIRLNGGLWQLPDDPFNLSSWGQQMLNLIDWSGWQWHVKCPDFWSDTSLWGFIGARMNTVDSVIAEVLEDAQLTLTYRRVFTGEGEVATGLLFNNIANGALVFEVVDRSGFAAEDGTIFGGTVFGGFARSLVQWSSGFIESFLVAVDDNQTLYPDEYWQSSWLATLAAAPAHTLRDSRYMDLQSKVSHAPATATRVVVGGDNPTVNAIVELIIQAAGNLIGFFLLGGFDSLGDIAADIIMPFLVGTIFAWAEWENKARKSRLGWIHLNEIYQSGGERNVWSLAAGAALLGGFEATDDQTSHTMVVGNNSWFIPGLHAQTGDRMASTSGALRRNAGINLLFVNRIKEMDLQGGAGGTGAHEFLTKIGENKAAMSIGERTARMLKKAFDHLYDIGVHIVA